MCNSEDFLKYENESLKSQNTRLQGKIKQKLIQLEFIKKDFYKEKTYNEIATYEAYLSNIRDDDVSVYSPWS